MRSVKRVGPLARHRCVGPLKNCPDVLFFWRLGISRPRAFVGFLKLAGLVRFPF